jgi:hypothetical protein
VSRITRVTGERGRTAAPDTVRRAELDVRARSHVHLGVPPEQIRRRDVCGNLHRVARVARRDSVIRCAVRERPGCQVARRSCRSRRGGVSGSVDRQDAVRDAELHRRASRVDVR